MQAPSSSLKVGRRPFWSRHLRREVQFFLDFLVLTVAFALAYLLRFDFLIPPEYFQRALIQLPVVVLVQFSAVLFAGIYSFVWRYVGMMEIRAFLQSAFYSSVPFLLMRFGLPERFEQWRVPLSVIVIDTVLAFGGLLALRVTRRALYERYERSRRIDDHKSPRSRPVILAGAGRAGVLAVREIQGRGDLDLELVGFVDDDPMKMGSVIHGLKVLGTSRDLPELARLHHIDHVVITIAEANAETIRGIVQTCERAGIRVRIIPGLFEILRGRVSISRFRDVEIEDLLGRATVQLDEDIVRRFITDKTVMVTGAGGSIGSELCRQIARFNPRKIVLFERAEGSLFNIDRELRELWPSQDIVPIVGDVGTKAHVLDVLSAERPHVILHAAAHKHVPLMEKNPCEAVRNNILGTYSLAESAAEKGVESFVLISTDKAVRPRSVMGATKRVAELVVQDLDRLHPKTRFLAVRFGNVMGSAGSVVPIFRDQIAHGGPVTVTDPEVTRYFMTIPEAAQLVLEAGALGGGGEIMILDMGQPVKILDLAKDMIALSGYKPFDEIPITFTGLRPGEKLSEQLQLQNEDMDRTRHPKIFVGRIEGLDHEILVQGLRELVSLTTNSIDCQVRSALGNLIPEGDLEGQQVSGAAPSVGPDEVLH